MYHCLFKDHEDKKTLIQGYKNVIDLMDTKKSNCR